MTPKNRQEHSKKFVSCSGNPLKEIKHGELQVDGSIKLVVDRIENTDEVIQSFAPSTMIENIMKRIEAGQVDLLNQKQGFFIDSVGLPENLADVLNLVNKGKETFEKLPVEVKERFDNDFNKWFLEMENREKWLEKSGFVSPIGETAREEKPKEGSEDVK